MISTLLTWTPRARALALSLSIALPLHAAAGAQAPGTPVAPGAPVVGPTPTRESLHQAVLAADARLSEALAARDLAALRALFHPRLEFFHDRNGLSDYATNVAVFERAFAGPVRITRTLLSAGLQIHPLPGVGAMQIGEHRFCSQAPGQPAECGTFGFSHVWEQGSDGAWRLLRVLSYGH